MTQKTSSTLDDRIHNHWKCAPKYSAIFDSNIHDHSCNTTPASFVVLRSLSCMLKARWLLIPNKGLINSWFMDSSGHDHLVFCSMGALWGQREVQRCLQAMLAEIHSGSSLLFSLVLPLFPEALQSCDYLLPAAVTWQASANLHLACP